MIRTFHFLYCNGECYLKLGLHIHFIRPLIKIKRFDKLTQTQTMHKNQFTTHKHTHTHTHTHTIYISKATWLSLFFILCPFQWSLSGATRQSVNLQSSSEESVVSKRAGDDYELTVPLIYVEDNDDIREPINSTLTEVSAWPLNQRRVGDSHNRLLHCVSETIVAVLRLCQWTCLFYRQLYS